MTIDIHSHLCPDDLPDFAEQFGDPRYPILRMSAQGSAEIIRDGQRYRTIDDRYWGRDRRLAYLDLHRIERQVISPLPVLLPAWAPPQEARQVCQWLNESVASFVRTRPDRFIGFGTLALQDRDAATDGLDRVADLGLAGVELGTLYGGGELGSGQFLEFFEAAAERHFPILIHPLEGGGDGGLGRMADPSIRFGIGVMSDTSITAASLMLAGVLRKLPDLKICLSHGGGSFFWALSRLKHVLTVSRGDSDAEKLIEDAKRFWVDTAMVGTENLRFLGEVLGQGSIMIGSDYPAASRIDPCAAAVQAQWTEESQVWEYTALDFLGMG